MELREIGAFSRRVVVVLAGACLIAGCAGGEGIFPLATLPPAAGPAPEYPSLVTPVAYEDAPPLLNSVEIEKMEEQLGRLPKDREAALRRRILQAR